MSWKDSHAVASPSVSRRLRLEALEQRILLAVTTGFTDGVLTITGDGDADAIAISTDTGAILLNDAAITDSPTTENTDSIVIQGGAGDDVISIDLTGGALAPGASSEETGTAEIEIEVDGGEGTDSVVITGETTDDALKGSGTGVNLTGDDDNDVTLAGVEDIAFSGGLGNDTITLTGWTQEDIDAIGITKISVSGDEGNDVLRNAAITGVTINGGEGDDYIRGKTAKEKLFGEGGDDTIIGGGGQDTLKAGDGNDVVKAGASGLTTKENKVYVEGGAGNDTILTYNGADTIYGGPGDDVMRGRPGKDKIYGGSGNDVLDGGNSDDSLYGEAGNDTLQGKTGNDVAEGGAGDDVLVNAVVDGGDDTLSGGDDTDLFRLKGTSAIDILELDWNDGDSVLKAVHKAADGTVIETESVSGAERVHVAGFGGNDVIDFRELDASDYSAAGITELNGYGGGGKDKLYGGPNAEYLFGGGARDSIWAGDGVDTLDGGSGNSDELYGEAGDDLILLLGKDDKIADGGDGKDEILGAGTNPLDESTIAFSGNATISGGAGKDTLAAGTGEDSLDGGEGNDSLIILDTLFEKISGASGSDRLILNGADLTINIKDHSGSTLTDLESIEISGSGDNKIILDKDSVLDISSTTDTLKLLGNKGDEADLGSGWSRVISSGSSSKKILTQGSAKIEVSGSIATSGVSSVFLLEDLKGSNGFRIDGIGTNDYSGFSVSAAGDVNKDGKDDIIIGAYGADADGTSNAGESYVVFGKKSFSRSLKLSTLSGSNGFRLDGDDTNDYSGYSVAAAGDMNNDDYDDIIIGAWGADTGTEGIDAGETYVVFGDKKFSSSLDLADLNGTDGFRLDGYMVWDYSSRSVSTAGDFNGDGFDDIVIGAYGADPTGSASGLSYVYWGKNVGYSPAEALKDLNGEAGIQIEGIDANDYSGFSVDTAGDVNGDGYDDILIGAHGVDNNTGQTYVVFGASSLDALISLEDLNGSNGFRLTGQNKDDYAGYSVSGAGDVNGDGYDDVLIGAYGADISGKAMPGSSYVFFGKRSGYSSNVNLGTLNGSAGFRIDGVDAHDHSGFSVSNAGDFNRDGYDDLLVGAYQGDPHGDNSAGETYLIFGQKNGDFPATLKLSSLEDTQGSVSYTHLRAHETLR